MQRSKLMKKDIKNDRLKVFIEGARLISDHEKNDLPGDKREAVSGKAGLWIEVACPEGACALEKDRITLPAGGVVPEETQGIWLSLFCPENRCAIVQSTDLP
jgi:hypothetical protein